MNALSPTPLAAATSQPPLPPEQMAKRMLGSDVPAAVLYRRQLLLLKATLEACQSMADQLVGVSRFMGWGDNDLDRLPEDIRMALTDACLAEEIERVGRALDIREDR